LTVDRGDGPAVAAAGPKELFANGDEVIVPTSAGIYKVSSTAPWGALPSATDGALLSSEAITVAPDTGDLRRQPQLICFPTSYCTEWLAMLQVLIAHDLV
jgi:hypothetical protein